jgi:predicted DNA-binding transcriptional regulator AlpA
MSELLTVKDLSARLRISARQSWKLLSAGKLPGPLRISRSVRWRRDDIDRWVSMGCPSRDVFEAAKSSGEAKVTR